MTSAERRALAAYVREVADSPLGLVDWKLILLTDKPDDVDANAAGYCNPIFGQATAHLWFADHFHEEEPTFARYVVAHELVHIPLHACWLAWQRPCEDILGAPVLEAIQANAITEWERAVDRIARAIAPSLPLISWDAEPDQDWISKAEGDMHLRSRLFTAGDRALPVP